MAAKVKHHGFAHLLLMAGLFLLAVVVFGGWTEGPLTSALFLGAKAYGAVSGAAAGDIEAAGVAATGLVPLIIVFIINLVIYYVAASAIIFVFNMVFGSKEAKAEKR